MVLDEINDWIPSDGIRQVYSLEDYLSYCQKIRSYLWGRMDLEKSLKVFFEKPFVEEMEPLSLICKAYFDEKEYPQVKTQYEPNGDKKFPDGKIMMGDAQEILVECVSAKGQEEFNRGLRNNNQENPEQYTSVSGLPDYPKENWGKGAIPVSKWLDYTEKALLNRINQKCKSIQEKSLAGSRVWLCVTLYEPLFTGNLAEQSLEQLNCFVQKFVTKHQQDLQGCSIEMLWLVANRMEEDWVQGYPVVDAS
jgi:hypothetical protein